MKIDMSNITTISHDFNGTEIKQRQSDGYLDATAMCKATCKLFADYRRLKATQDFLVELEGSMGIPIDHIIQMVNDGPNDERGTWIEPHAAINLAQWSSPKFAVLVTNWVFELMTTGRVELQPEQATPQTLTATPDQNLVNGLFLINATADALRMSTDSRLKLLHNLTEEHGLSKNLLPAYSEGQTTKALATLLKEHNAGFGAAKANKILIELGVLEERQRPSTSKGVKRFKSLTEEGLFYGKNLVSPNNPRETQPHYYVNKFQDLLDRIDSFLRGDTVMGGVV